MVHDILKLGQLPDESGFSADGPDFLFDHNDEMELEAPRTADLITTGDFVDDMDGWQVWSESKGKMDQAAYISALRKDYNEALTLYHSETNSIWEPK